MSCHEEGKPLQARGPVGPTRSRVGERSAGEVCGDAVDRGVAGNEDGAHHVGAELFQGLNDVGFTIPAGGMTYWVGEAMHGLDYKDRGPADKTDKATAAAAANAAHLAGLLRAAGYPAQ
jgi:hypothetical protein